MKPNIQSVATEVLDAYGRARLARELGIAAPSLYKWDRLGIPPRRVLDVERLTGRSRHELRPDIFGPEPLETTLPRRELDQAEEFVSTE